MAFPLRLALTAAELQDKEQALEQATQAALDASSAAEAQHSALAKQLALEKRDLQDQADKVRHPTA